MSAVRPEKRRHNVGSTPTTSDRPDGRNRQATPSRSVSSYRSRAWYTAWAAGRVVEEASAVEGRPPPVDTLGHVGHHHVGMEVWVEGSAGAVEEGARRQSGGVESDPCTLTAPSHPGRGPFEVTGGVGHRRRVAKSHLGGHLGGGQQVEDAHRLRGAEREIEAGRPLGPLPTEARPTAWMASGQQLGELNPGDRAAQPEVGSPLPGPRPRDFAGQPRSLGPPGHEVVDVIGVTAPMEDVDPEQPAPRGQPVVIAHRGCLRPLS